ncbi:unnamed protein product [Macrosiphum euphorbiae]|uniref:DDE Tnp4 domain-containing protein n=1 Tax=Macrosiphum euphorbiae TaxID=13131 RepID=A0AAV0XQP4_9HEMI|nr:unnamed protein product [Macrosiphum euphorbiae]
MDLCFLGWELGLLEKRVRTVERRLERRMLRDTKNAYELPRNEFMDIFRLSPELSMYLTNTLRPFLQREHNYGIPVEIQVLVAVKLYAKGSYQRATGDNFDLNVSQPSVSRCLHAVTDAINNNLLRQWVRFPMTNLERNNAREEFCNAPQPFEGAIGAIDCTYINILASKDHEEAFVNHHGNHSLNVQAAVSPKLKILNINARYPGARNDSYIWSTSPIRRAMEFHYNKGERHTWLIGDSGYPLEPWLMTPLPHYREGTRQFKYTMKHCKARNIVERFFGVFKSVWRCLYYQRVLMYAPDMAGKIVNACAVLHNMRIHYRIPIDVENIENGNNDEYAIRNFQQNEDEIAERGGPRAVAMRIQKQILQNWFHGYIDGDA